MLITDDNQYKEKLNISIENINKEHKKAIEIFFEVMQNLGDIGGSQWLSFYSDGDGNFRPKITLNGKNAEDIKEDIDLKQFWTNEGFEIDFDSLYGQLKDASVRLRDHRPETSYKLHFRTDFQGIPISVENRKGSYRSGTDRDGKEWRQKMDYHYGRIPRTRGNDGDAVDVFIGPNKTSDKVFIIEQVWPDTGKFDEHKVMLGFLTKAEAIRGYKSQYNRPGFYGGCITMSMQEFKAWLKEQAPRKVERRNLENRVINGQRVIGDSVKGKDMKIIENDGVITGGITDESNFDKLVKKLIKENGYSEDRAKRIAYSIGVKKYGKAGMTAKSIAGRKDAVPEMDNGSEPVGDVAHAPAPAPTITGDFITDEEMESISEMEDDYLGWDKLVKELMAKGHSKKSAENIAATIGRKKYGAAGMAAKAAAGRDAESVDDSEITPILQSEGKHTGTDYSKYVPKELALGILVEKEHADDPIDRMEIASDHLEEKQNYYSDPSSFFLSELRKEYGDQLVPEYQKALEYVNKVVSGEQEITDGIDFSARLKNLRERRAYTDEDGVKHYDMDEEGNMLETPMVEDTPSATSVILEASATPVIKKLMQAMGFKKLFWKGSGWVIPIGLDEYGNYLKMIPKLKIYDAMLQKFGYEISLAPGWFKIVPVEK